MTDGNETLKILTQVRDGEIDSDLKTDKLANDYAAQHGIDLNYRGNMHSPEIPFPGPSGKTEMEWEEAMYSFINQSDIAYYVDAPLALFSIEERMESLKRVLKSGDHVEPVEQLEQELAVWSFMNDHLDDSRLSYFKTINDQRVIRLSRINERRKTAISVESSLKQDPTNNAQTREEVTIPEIKPAEKSLWQKVVEDNKVPDWITQNFKNMPADDVVIFFKENVQRSPDDPLRKEELAVIDHILKNIDQFQNVKDVIEERRRKFAR